MDIKKFAKRTLAGLVFTAALFNPLSAADKPYTEKDVASFERVNKQELAALKKQKVKDINFSYGQKLIDKKNALEESRLAKNEKSKKTPMEELLEDKALEYLRQSKKSNASEAMNLILEVHSSDIKYKPNEKGQYLKSIIKDANDLLKQVKSKKYSDQRRAINGLLGDTHFVWGDILEREATFSKDKPDEISIQYKKASEEFKESAENYKDAKKKEKYNEAISRRKANEDHAEFMLKLVSKIKNPKGKKDIEDLGIELLKRGKYEKAMSAFKKAGKKNGDLSVAEYMLNSGTERKTPKGITESQVEEYKEKVAGHDSKGLVDLIGKFSIEPDLKDEAILACGKVEAKDWDYLTTFGAKLENFLNANSEFKGAKLEDMMKAAIKFSSLAEKEDRLYMKTELLKRSLIQYRNVLGKAQEGSTEHTEATAMIPNLEAELEKYNVDIPALAVNVEPKVKVPKNAVLYMTFDEGTIVYDKKIKKWIVKDLSVKNNHGIIHGKFASKNGRPIIYTSEEDVPDGFDMALIKSPSGNKGDYAIYNSGKGGYIVIPNSEGKGRLEETFTKDKYSLHLKFKVIGKPDMNASIIDQQDDTQPWAGFALKYAESISYRTIFKNGTSNTSNTDFLVNEWSTFVFVHEFPNLKINQKSFKLTLRNDASSKSDMYITNDPALNKTMQISMDYYHVIDNN